MSLDTVILKKGSDRRLESDVNVSGEKIVIVEGGNNLEFEPGTGLNVQGLWRI